MINSTTSWGLPPLPSYTLTPRPSLVPYIPDKYMSLLLPIIAYWALSMTFHFIDTRDYFPQYRLHTPMEVAKRNRATRWEVVRDVVLQQAIQTVVGVILVMGDEDEFDGKDDYNVAVWAQRLRIAQRLIPGMLAGLGLDARALAQKISPSSPSIAGALLGGRYSALVSASGLPSFAAWELGVARLMYWLVVPALQFTAAIIFVDTWQYFLHRAMHMNKWLYTTFHSRHHRLYVPYAYGALYNHPFEGFLLDILGTGVSSLIFGLSARQAICFYTGSTIKTVDDHCGYALPWDPLQHLTSNNAGYHDIHHQSWGIKTNFSQPFFTFWDRALGTVWTGGDVSARYERARKAAERKKSSASESTQNRSRTPSISSSNATDSKRQKDAPYNIHAARASISATASSVQAALTEEQNYSKLSSGDAGNPVDGNVEDLDERNTFFSQKKPRRRTIQSPTAQAGSLKGLRDRVAGGSGSFHGRAGGVLGYESTT